MNVLRNISLTRSRWYFHAFVGAFVILISFLYGLVSGWDKQLEQAHASFPAFPSSPLSELSLPDSVSLPSEVQLISVAREARINGKPGEMISFVTERGIKSLVAEQLRIWRGRGFSAFGKAGRERGVAVARDEISGTRYSLAVWLERKRSGARSSLRPIRGMLSLIYGTEDSEAEDAEYLGEVPGVPPLPGGSVGSVMSSLERNGRSYSGAYSNPGSLSENREYYRSHFAASGWKLAGEFDTSLASQGSGTMRFVRGEEEVMLLFSERQLETSEALTVVSVARYPRV